jgi:hypothetical protein
MNSFKVFLRGSEMLTVKLSLANIIPNQDLASYKQSNQIFPANIELRKNLTLTLCMDLMDLIGSSNDILITNNQDQTPSWDLE